MKKFVVILLVSLLVTGLIFAKNTLQNDDYQLYRRIFNIIYTSLPKPDIYVYLHVETSKLIENIHKRGRSYEQEINQDYLNKIQKAYFDYFKQQQNFTFLIIDTNNIDFVKNNNDFNKLKEVIFNKQYKKGINRIKF